MRALAFVVSTLFVIICPLFAQIDAPFTPLDPAWFGTVATPAVATAFSPTDISNLRTWLKADAITANDGDLITTWPESSGNGTAMNAPTDRRPYYTNVVGVGKAIVFDGQNDYMTNPASAVSYTSDHTMIVVMDQGIVGIGQEVAGWAMALSRITDWAQHGVVTKTPTQQKDAIATTALPFTLAVYANVWDSGTSLTAYSNTVSIGTINTSNTGLRDLASCGYRFGSLGAEAYYRVTRIYEFLDYEKPLDPTELGQVVGYLRGKYGF